MKKIFNALLSVDLESVQQRKDVENHLMDRLEDRANVQFLMKNLKRTPEGTYKWKANVEALYDNYKSIVASIDYSYEIDHEVLFVHGDRSNYLIEEDKAGIVSVLPESNFKKIENAGHWVHADQPELLLQEVKEFLDK